VAKKELNVQIKAPNLQIAEFKIRGTAPFVQHRFSQKALEMIRAKQAAGDQTRKGNPREAKDFDALYLSSMYEGPDGKRGLHAAAFRNGMISACRICGFKMTVAKLSVFVVADCHDIYDHTPMVLFALGEPEKIEDPMRNDKGGADIRVRAMWAPGWEAVLRLRFDADQFSVADVANLLMRVGLQVGVGEGRPDSKKSAGCGWGTFEIVQG